MAQRRQIPALLIAAPAAPPTFTEVVGAHIRRQADEALKAGMGMTAFFAWATQYAIVDRGIDHDAACDLILEAWNDAWDEWRATELEAA